jgi:hypothetical protein
VPHPSENIRLIFLDSLPAAASIAYLASMQFALNEISVDGNA